MKLKLLLGLLIISLDAHGLSASILVQPPSPSTNDVVTIRLENTFGSEAAVASSSISRVGNTFVIDQNVDLSCFTPSNPLVVSEFQVGPLPPGAYDITATITFNGSPFPCSKAPITQTTSFAVAAVSIPSLGTTGLLILAVALAAVALCVIRQ